MAKEKQHYDTAPQWDVVMLFLPPPLYSKKYHNGDFISFLLGLFYKKVQAFEFPAVPITAATKSLITDE